MLAANVASAQSTSPRAFSRAPDGALWVAAVDYLSGSPVNPRVEKRDAAGALLASVALPGANDSGQWGFVFNADGTAWLAGATDAGTGPRVTLWKVAAGGDALLDTRVLDAGGPSIPGGLARDASGFLWLSGVDLPSQTLFRFALWKLDAAGAVLPGFPVTRERGGGADGGLAVAAAPDGSVWSLGVSSDPATGRLDLGLWRYADGVLSEHHQPSAFLDLKGAVGALRVRADGSLWAAASKAYASCSGTDFALLRLDLAGALVSSSSWHSETGGAMGAALALDLGGGLWAAGVAGAAPALWRFDASGALSAGYPKGAASFFEPAFLVLDSLDRPWVVAGAQPSLFDEGPSLSGASGPGACAAAPGTLAGAVSGGFADGSLVTVAVTTDPFSHSTVAMQAFPASGGNVLYTFPLPGGASYYVMAFEGANPDNIGAATPIGSYAHWSPVYVAGGGSASADFALAPDATPPSSRITSIADGGALDALASIDGTAADGTAAEFGELAVKDETAGLWWDPQAAGWTAAVDPLYFRVSGQALSGTPESFSWRVGAQELGGLAERLTTNHQYRLSARASDFSRNVEPAPQAVLFTWTAAMPVTPPQNVTGAAVSADAVSWTWSLVEGATGYAVYAEGGERLATVAAPPFLQEGLGPNGSSRVCVAASGSLGDSGPSCAGPAVTWALTPGVPQPQRAEPDRLEWLWDVAGNPAYTGYELQLSSDGFTQSSATYFTGSLAAGTSFIAGGLEPDRVYEARVRALNGAGLPTAWSASASTRTLQAPPGAPAGLTLSFDAAARVVRLSWTPGAGTSATYAVYRGFSASTETFSQVLVDLTQASAEDPVFQSGLHYYQVSARNADRLEGPRSEAASVLVDLDPPGVVSDLRVWTREQPGTADLLWTAPSDALTGVARYEVRTATWPLSAADFEGGAEVPQSLVPAAGGSAESLVVTVPTGETRYYALRAFDGAGNASVSNAAVYDAVPPVITGLGLEPDSLLSRPRRVAVSASDDATAVTFHFFVDGQPRGTLAGPWAEFFWDTRLETDGPHLFDVLARDAGGNEAYASRAVMVSYAPPGAPSIGTPGDGFVTKVATLAVSGWADPEAAGVQLQVDGLDLATATIVNGAWSIDPAVLPYEGDVSLTAIAFESRGFSGPSYPVRVSFGQTAPGEPTLLSADLVSGGRVSLSWSRGTGKTPSFYRVYRSVLDDLIPGEAPPLERRLAQATAAAYIDAPQVQDLYFYGVTAEDNAGNESPLSELVYAFTDAVAPTAAVVTASGTTGPGLYPLLLTVSEPLARPPLLTFAPAAGSPAPVELHAETALLWRGTVTVTAEMAPGLSAFAFEAMDLAGNLGSGAPAHEPLTLDTRGPQGALALSRPSPLKAGALTLTLSLDEPVPHAPALSWRGQPLTLTGADGSWSATLAVDALTGDGEALLAYEGVDRFGNRSSLLSGTTAFVIDTVAPGEPVAVRANARAAGFIFLSWSGPLGEAPTYYRIYRDGVFVTTAAPASDLTGLFLDHPVEGPHNYEVSSLDAAGNESALSDPPATADASPPAAPVALAAGLNAFGQVELSWQPGDAEAVSFRLYRATQAFASVAGLPGRPAAAPFVESLDADGLYHWRVTAFDAVGNESAPSEAASLSYDKAAPVIAISGVEEGGHYKASVSPSFSAQDGNLDAGSVRGLLDGQPFASGSAVTAEGAHTLVVEAADTEGHAASRSVSFTLDLTAPAITLSGPAEGAVLKEQAAVAVSLADAHLAATTVTVTNATLGTMGVYASGTPLTRDGIYTVTARASDRAGNETVRTLSFRLDLAPVAPAGLKVTAGQGATLTWEQPEPDVRAYRVYRDGARVSGSLHADRRFDDALVGRVYEVSAVDAEGQEGPRARAEVPAVSLSLLGGTLTHGFFDALRVQARNDSGAALSVGPALMEILGAGVALASAPAAAADIPAGGSGELRGVIATPLALPAGTVLRARVAVADASVTLVKDFPVAGQAPKEPILEVFPDTLLKGAESPVRLRLYNRGSAALDIVTAKVQGSTAAAVDDVTVRLRTSNGTILSSGKIRQTAGTAAAFRGAEQVFFVSVPPGGSVLLEGVRVPVPNTVEGTVVVEASVSTPTHSMGLGPIAGTRGFSSSGAQGVTADLPYTATAAAEREVYDQGSSVTVTGMTLDAAGAPTPNAFVAVHVVSEGFDRQLSAVSDAAGVFRAVFLPLPNEAGIYTVSAAHPLVASPSPQGSFAIAGFGFEYSRFDATLAQNSSYSFPLRLRNLGATALEGLALSTEALTGSGLAVTVAGLPASLPAGGEALLTVTGAASPTASSATARLAVRESHGFTREIPLSFLVQPAVVLPKVTPQPLSLGLLAGETRAVVLTLENKGFETWRDVTLTAPSLSWVRVQGPLALGDLPPGGNANVTLSFEPPAGLPNQTYAAPLLLQVLSANSPAVPIAASIAVTSTRKGGVLLETIDADKPRTNGQGVGIAGAAATLISLDVAGLQFKQTSDLNGVARFLDVPAGNYAWRSEATGYQSRGGTAVIEPGLENRIEALLATAVVTYEWKVTPTTIQDKYDIRLDLAFRTDVPAPVLVIDPPLLNFHLEGGQTAFGQYTITNKGLISVRDYRISLTGDAALRLESPISVIPEIKAGQSVVVPFKATLLSASCHAGNVGGDGRYTCAAGDETNTKAPDLKITAGTTCGAPTSGGSLSSAGGGGFGSSGSLEVATSLGAPSLSSRGCPRAPAGPTPSRGASPGVQPAQKTRVDPTVGGHKVTPPPDNLQSCNSPGLSFPSSYNSLRRDPGRLGYGWYNDSEVEIVENPDGSFTLKDGEGNTTIFVPTGPLDQPLNGGSQGQFARPVGYHQSLEYRTMDMRSSNQVVFTEYDTDGNATAYQDFNGKILPVATSDRNGNATLYTRNPDGSIHRMTDVHGRWLEFGYDGFNQLASVSDQAGRVTRYYRDGAGDLVRRVDPLGDEIQYSYDDQHRMTGIVYPNGGRKTFTYQPDGRVASEHDEASDNRLTYEYFGSSTVVSDSRGGVTVYEWIEVGGSRKVTRVTDAQGGTTRIVYDAGLNASEVTDPLGRVTRMRHDVSGNLLSSTDAQGRTTQVVYANPASGTLAEDEAALGPLDALAAEGSAKGGGRAGAAEVTFGSSLRFAVGEPRNLPGRVTDAKGNQTRFAYDAKGNMVEVRDALGNGTRMTYDGQGHVTGVKDALGRVTSFGYDALGALGETVDPLGRRSVMTRDGLSRVTLARDPAGKETSFAYDSLGNMTRVTDALGGVTSFGYEAGRPVRVLKTVTDAKNHSTTFGYDVVGRVVSVTNALNQTKSFGYDADSRLVSVLDAKGQSLSFEYDILGRVVKKTSPEGVVTYDWDAVGNLTRVVNYNGSAIEMSYDSAYRVTQVVQTLPGGFSATIGYAYDGNGNRTRMTTPWGAFSYAYDALNRLTSITNPQMKTFTFAYDALGRRTKLTYPNGTEATYAWDAAGQLKQILHRKTSNNTAVAMANYTYDAAGNPVTLEDLNGVHSFGYDDLHRLISASHPPGSSVEIKNETFDYDLAGNRTADARATGYVYDAANRLQEDSRYSYTNDANGNRTSRTDKETGATMTLHYDSENRLTRVDLPDGTRSSYQYDAAGRRVEKSAGSISSPTVTRFVYDGADVLAMLDGSNNPIAVFTHGPGINAPLLMRRGSGEDFFYHADMLGSIVSLTDNAGVVVERVDYEAYGRPTFIDVRGPILRAGRSAVGNPFAHTGVSFDEDSGLVAYRFRSRDAEVGVFIQEDPIGFAAGDLNLYRYAAGIPSALVDPLGLFGEVIDLSWTYTVAKGDVGPGAVFGVVWDRRTGLVYGYSGAGLVYGGGPAIQSNVGFRDPTPQEGFTWVAGASSAGPRAPGITGSLDKEAILAKSLDQFGGTFGAGWGRGGSVTYVGTFQLNERDWRGQIQDFLNYDPKKYLGWRMANGRCEK